MFGTNPVRRHGGPSTARRPCCANSLGPRSTSFFLASEAFRPTEQRSPPRRSIRGLPSYQVRPDGRDQPHGVRSRALPLLPPFGPRHAKRSPRRCVNPICARREKLVPVKDVNAPNFCTQHSADRGRQERRSNVLASALRPTPHVGGSADAVAKSDLEIRQEQLDPVLLVEDDVPVAEALSRMLDDYQVHHASNATDAARLLTERRWTAAIVDIGLPEGELAGIDVLRAARAHDAMLPMLAITGLLASGETTSYAIALGGLRIGVSIAPKPVLRADILEFMQRAVLARMPLERYLQTRGFSPREAALIAWVAEGETVKSYAKHAGLSLSTVKTYVARILQRTGAASIHGLIIAIERERFGSWF